MLTKRGGFGGKCLTIKGLGGFMGVFWLETVASCRILMHRGLHGVGSGGYVGCGRGLGVSLFERFDDVVGHGSPPLVDE